MVTCRDYEQGDEVAILELFRIVFGKHRSRRFWEWQYLEPPAGKGLIKLMFDGDCLIGHYAAVPVELNLGGKTVSALQSIDTMIHPKYQRRGFFTRLATAFFEEQESLDHNLIYGFPNKNSYHGLVHNLSWTGFGLINEFVVEADELRTHSHKTLPSAHHLDRFDESIDSLWLCVRERNGVAVERTSQYMNWRFVAKPEVRYSLLGVKESNGNLEGYAVTKIHSIRGQPVGHIVDLVCRHTDETRPLLDACYSELLGKVSRISCWFRDCSPVANHLRSDGFRVEQSETYFGMKLLSESPELLQARVRENWYFTMGASDVF